MSEIPKVGEIVHFDRIGGECRAAIVSKRPGAGGFDLAVLDPHSLTQLSGRTFPPAHFDMIFDVDSSDVHRIDNCGSAS